MITEELRKVFVKDLQKLKEEISLYTDEASLWKVEGNIANSAGNLCLHVVGSLNHFIGNVIGHTNYVRNRDAEFSSKDVPKTQLIELVEKTVAMINEVVPKITIEQLQEEYPIILFKEKMTTGYFLFHLESHLGYHLGQINYHRRLLANQ